MICLRLPRIISRKTVVFIFWIMNTIISTLFISSTDLPRNEVLAGVPVHSPACRLVHQWNACCAEALTPYLLLGQDLSPATDDTGKIVFEVVSGLWNADR